MHKISNVSGVKINRLILTRNMLSSQPFVTSNTVHRLFSLKNTGYGVSTNPVQCIYPLLTGLTSHDEKEGHFHGHQFDCSEVFPASQGGLLAALTNSRGTRPGLPGDVSLNAGHFYCTLLFALQLLEYEFGITFMGILKYIGFYCYLSYLHS